MIDKPDYIAHADGGSRGNPGEAAYGFVVFDGKMNKLYEEGKKIGVNTNNVAEYKGVVGALQWIDKNLPKNLRIQFYLDSLLVVSQLEGIWKIKNENLRNLFFTAKTLEDKIGGQIHYHQVPREKNAHADRMVNLALDNII